MKVYVGRVELKSVNHGMRLAYVICIKVRVCPFQLTIPDGQGALRQPVVSQRNMCTGNCEF
jgi:hypothetical protein